MQTPIIDIAGFPVGGPETYIIAEVGSNHNQSLDLAYEHIDVAAEAGAHACKFQSILIDKLYYAPTQSTKELHASIDMAEEWHALLKAHCEKRGVTFFSSPTYMEAVDLLEKLDVAMYKLASAQIGTFPQIVKKVAEQGRPTIMSTGIVSYSELERMVNIFRQAGNDKFIILHCNSIYPTPPNRVNLGIMDTYRHMFGNPVGFSDHTTGIGVPIAAVARGAKVIEKHFALSRQLPVPDAPFSLEPDELRAMITGIKQAEQAVADASRTELQPEENRFKQGILSRLVLNTDKKAGEAFSESDFKFLRHPSGVDARDMDWMLSRNGKAARNLAAGELLEWDGVAY